MAYATGSSWSWPKEEELEQIRARAAAGDASYIPGSFATDEEPESTENGSARHNVPEDDGSSDRRSKAHHPAPETPPPKHRYYGPRTCRICLEVVHPTFEAPSEETLSLPSFLRPSPKAEYISQEAESGRLIRPCKCKGSQRYVHEGCLQQWRHADPAYSNRNYFECPTCKYRYHLERLKWGAWISSTVMQIVLTVLILFTTVFLLGFVAEPIIGLYIDPVGTLTTNPLSRGDLPFLEEDRRTWSEHILGGLASLGLLGFIKAFFAMGPWQWWNLRQSGLLNGGGGGNRRRANAGRDRLENISWTLVLIGVATFLYAVWKMVRAWSRRTLEMAGERVADVQGDDDADEEEDDHNADARGTTNTS